MAETATLFAVALSLFTLALNIGLKKKTKKKGFTCFQCNKPMRQFYVSEGVLPREIRQYLDKHSLPIQVVRRYRCPVFHRELWIAPAVTGEEKGLFVSRELD